MTTDLAKKKCVPCEGGVDKLGPEAVQHYLTMVEGWELDGDKIVINGKPILVTAILSWSRSRANCASSCRAVARLASVSLRRWRVRVNCSRNWSRSAW